MAAVLPGAVAAPADSRIVEKGKLNAWAFAGILAQLGLITLVFRQFQIEGGAFLRLWLLALAGFLVHALLPLRYRLPFFLGLSLASIALILGLTNGAWLVAIGRSYSSSLCIRAGRRS